MLLLSFIRPTAKFKRKGPTERTHFHQEADCIVPINQWQHLVPKVYLKQWAKDNCITILDCAGGQCRQVEIAMFTTKLNFYDITWAESDLAKHNEIELGRLEKDYCSFLKTIQTQRGLKQEKWQAYCDRLVALMFVRTETYWSAFNNALNNSVEREKLLNEIYENPLERCSQRIVLELFYQTQPVNIVLCDIARKVQTKLKEFNQIILHTNPVERPFFTSTNPVLVFSHCSGVSTLFDWSSEVYLPLSPEFCLYMYHPIHCNNINFLQEFQNGEISQAPPEFVWDLNTKLSMLSGSTEYVMPHWIDVPEFIRMEEDELENLDKQLGGFFT